MKVTEKECLEAVKTINDYFDESWTFNDCGCCDKDGVEISMDTGYFFGGLDSVEGYLINKNKE